MNQSSIFRTGGTLALTFLVVLVASFLAYGVTREIPVGHLSGQVTMGEEGKPLANAAIILRPKTNDETGSARVRFFRADGDGKFTLRNLPAALYSVEVQAIAHELPRTQLLIEEGKSQVADLKLKPIEPYLNLYTTDHVFMPKEDPNVQVHGFVPVKDLDVRVYQVPVSLLMAQKDFYRVFSPIARAETPELIQKSNPDVKMVQQFDWPIRPTEAEGTFRRTLALPKLKPGFYFVRVQATPSPESKKPNVVRGTYLLVSEVGIVAKRAKDSVEIFASNLETGKPVADAPVRFAQNAGVRDVGRTNANGRLTIPAQAMEAYQTSPTAIVATMGESNAVITFNDYGDGSQGMRFGITTDRPIYRPGDTVHFRAIARKQDGARYQLPSQATAIMEVQDNEARVLTSKTLSITAYGTINGDFKLPEASSEGVRLIIKVGAAEGERYINVASYRKPEFKITATPVKPYYLRGDRVEMRVKCEYYFGGPVVGSTISGSVSGAPLWSWTDPETGEEISYGDGEWGDYLGDVEGVTNGDGEVILSFDTRGLKLGTWQQGTDMNLSFSLYGSEGDDRYFEGKGSVNLLQGDLSIQMDQNRWVASPGEEVEFTITLTAPDETGKATLGNRSITVETGYEVWDAKGSVFTPEGKQVVVTDASGVATIKVKPQNPGDFRIRAVAKDRRGADIQASLWLWVYREGFSFEGPAPQLQVILDKRTYIPGETVKAVIRGEANSGTAWVTLETDTIRDEQMVELSTGMGTVEFKTSPDLIPNAFVTVSLIRNKQFSESRRRVTLDLRDQKVNLVVTSDKAVYKPGETAAYKIKATDSEGKPVQAEVSLGVVDESIYAIAEDDDDPLTTFYPVRESLIPTYHSFPSLYLDGGDKGEKSIDIREDFRDTATWAPTLETDANGEATLTVKMPDNLTSWRATATAVTKDTRVGKTTQNLVVKKDLMVRLATPMFLTQLDETTLTANVNNGTDKALDVTVELRGTGIELVSASKQSIRLEPNRAGQVSWPIRLPAAGQANLEVVAISGSLNDGMRVSVPVRVHGRRVISGQTGELPEGETRLEIETDAAAKEGHLTIRTAPTLIAPLLTSIEALVDFPYGCVEQTLSRFVPAAVARQLMRESGIDKPELEAKIDQVTLQSLVRLKEMQQSDGGWGWFAGEGGHPYTTAIALEGFARARAAGVNVDKLVVSNGVAWGERWLKSEAAKTASPDERVALAYAMNLHREVPTAVTVLRMEALRWSPQPEEVRELDIEALTQIGLGLKNAPDAGSETRRRTVLEELWSRAEVREDWIRWPDAWGARNTARVLETLLALTPQDERIPKVVNGLILLRQGAQWTSTYDSALAIQALVPYVRATGGVGNDATIQVLVNGVDRSLIRSGPLSEIKLPLSELRAGKYEVVIRRIGEGRGFFNWTLDEFPFRESLPALVNPKLKITRTFHTLGAERAEDGSLNLTPSKNPLTRFESGKPIRCIVTIEATEALDYAMIEIPLPSNAKLRVNESPDTWDFWYTGLNVLDDRVAFFARQVPVGKSTIEFNLMAEATGTAAVLPAQVMEMYAPDRQASTSNLRLEVFK